uniref:GPI ethanolamine phosphate transferase 2 n=1 Tax=Dracunculus medinensis TaxID=318479 RepID=A0A0N4UFF6_DRAME
LENAIRNRTSNKLVLMLIDAWRSEFLFGSHENNHMPFLNRLRLFDHVSSYNAHLQPPTVTMPRIKAITAGIIPSFVDVLLNFASDSMNDDNIIDRLWKSGRRLMFCGDDTWLKLFPGRFLDRSEGIVSFYVNDYIEVGLLISSPSISLIFRTSLFSNDWTAFSDLQVDNNVTLCLKKELTNETISTWDVMILHYLGLDHIGHSLGGESNILHKKLKEMDGIIENIYDTLVRVHNSNFSMLIFGDHGMTEAGNHGGSSEKEVNVPLIYIDGQRIQGARSILFSAIYSIEQIDIVPTLASIFNFEIPVKSLGITFVDQLVPRKRKKDYLMPLVSLLKNSYQITGLLDVANAHLNNCIEDCIKNLEGFCHKRNLSQISLASNIASCKKSLHSVQEKLMTKEAAFKSFSYIFLGICISIMVSCISIWLLFSTVAIAQTVAKTHNEPFMNG